LENGPSEIEQICRSLNAIAAELKNCPFFELIQRFSSKTISITNNNNKKKQQNTIKVSILKGIPKYYNGILVVSIFSFAHFSNS
jgi:hypothetical protein